MFVSGKDKYCLLEIDMLKKLSCQPDNQKVKT